MAHTPLKIIAANGIIGTYTHQAFEALAIENTTYKAYATFSEVCQALGSKQVGYALIPVHNSTIGPVLPALDALKSHTFQKITEITLPINHTLVGGQSSTLESITHVTSYSVALEQCANTLKKLNLKAINHMGTAEAVLEVIAKNDPTLAAIGPYNAAINNHGRILMHPCNDAPKNATTFYLFKSS